MNKKFFIKNAKESVGNEVTVKGWVFNKRSSGGIIFLHVRDGSGFLQATVVKDEVDEKVFSITETITIETSVIVTGLLKEEKRAPGGYEISVKALEIVQLVAQEYPISKKDHGPDFLLSHRHLWLRSRRQWAILRIRDMIMQAIQKFLHEQDFIRFDAPIITPSACEGTTTLFELDYFGEKSYLTQSGQLYLEAAIASFGRVYDFGPIMRAEKSKTRRHLIEFWMMDAEAAFMEFDENIELQEKLIKYVVGHILRSASPELALIQRDIKPLQLVVDKPFVRLTYDEALKKLHELGSDIKDGEDFGNDDETILMTHYQVPVFVTHFPAQFKAFYFKRKENDESHVLAADLLAPEGYGEIIGGGAREDDYEILKKRIQDEGINEKDYQWYLDLRKFGSIPHSGFGVGLERLVAWICKLEHVRETIPFPRMLERFRP